MKYKCESCDSEVSLNDSFCTSCGSQFDAVNIKAKGKGLEALMKKYKDSALGYKEGLRGGGLPTLHKELKPLKKEYGKRMKVLYAEALKKDGYDPNDPDSEVDHGMYEFEDVSGYVFISKVDENKIGKMELPVLKYMKPLAFKLNGESWFLHGGFVGP